MLLLYVCCIVSLSIVDAVDACAEFGKISPQHTNYSEETSPLYINSNMDIMYCFRAGHPGGYPPRDLSNIESLKKMEEMRYLFFIVDAPTNFINLAGLLQLTMVKTLSLSRLSRLYLPVLSSLTLPRAFHSFSPAIPSSRSRTERAYSLKMSSASETAVVEDPYTFLEDVEAEVSLEFARAANDKCLAALGDPKDGPSYQRVLDVLESNDRIPHASSNGLDENGKRVLFNFWKDAKNPKGIWRKTTLDDYKSEDPKWKTVLDVDDLAKKDGISWVWKGSRALPRKRDPMSDNGRIVTRCLLSLSRGGSDATFLKEFDMLSEEFVIDDPFNMPEAKTRASYKSRDVLLVGSSFEDSPEDSLTDSGYPRTVREWERGTPISEAKTVFEGEKTDVAVNGYVADERNWGGKIYQVHSRSITFYTSSYFMAELTEDHLLAPSKRPAGLPEPEFKKVDVQDDADISFLGNMFIISLRSDWAPKDKTFKSGSVIYCPLDKFLNEGSKGVEYEILFEPTERTAYEYFSCTKNYLILSTMDNVKSKLQFFKIGDAGNSLTLISGDTEAQIRDCSAQPLDPADGDEFWFTTSSYTQPTTLYLADATKMEDASSSGEGGDDPFIVEKVKTLPPQYDSDGLIVEQRFATSKDGTEVPYFIVMKKDIVLNGKNPTLLYGYGGFEISLGPHYIATSGLAWLERGGVYVEANIRGGGEFGPKWHQAALKENRNKAYEDFIAVGEHLIDSGICKPKTLATRGGSNGGLLMGNMYTMRPDLFGAIHCAVPLLDMKRFHTLLAGASWMAEYGNPDTDDWDKFLHRYSPYHNIDESQESYPPILVTTSTRDDRVHPAHARKFVKKLWDLGEGKDWPVYYYENIEGGHGGAANAKQSSFMTSLAYDFMFDTLTKNAESMD